jgi:hypothetical protein
VKIVSELLLLPLKYLTSTFAVLRLDNLKSDELAEELSGQFEGDIIISPEQLNDLLKRHERTGLINTAFRWPDSTVPYQIKIEDFGKVSTSIFVHARYN